VTRAVRGARTADASAAATPLTEEGAAFWEKEQGATRGGAAFEASSSTEEGGEEKHHQIAAQMTPSRGPHGPPDKGTGGGAAFEAVARDHGERGEDHGTELGGHGKDLGGGGGGRGGAGGWDGSRTTSAESCQEAGVAFRVDHALAARLARSSSQGYEPYFLVRLRALDFRKVTSSSSSQGYGP
jgi:hypothetical protein